MRKAEPRIDNEGAFGGIESLSGEEGSIWNHGSGWTGKSCMSVAPSIQGGAQLTCASVIGLKFVFLEDELIVYVLNIGQVEIRFSDDKRGFWGVHLRRL